ncbi:MAG TPA: DUF6438 domain-containing protein [Gemmatimonadales bacterium]|nr:DUF6438 domain-containing protein [Gemmatimonadales bacterium]
MRSHPHRMAVGALACTWLTAACARPSPPVPQTEVRAAPSARELGTVSLERGPCFGTCPVYSVTVDRSGAVRFEGRRFVRDTGVSVGTVSPSAVDSLLAELDGSGYFALEDLYRMGEPVCPRFATDLPTVVTQVRIGERVKRIEHDRGCADAPEILSRLETRIDEVTGSARWIGR